MRISEILNDRNKLIKLYWIAWISSLVFIGIGVVIILSDIFS